VAGKRKRSWKRIVLWVIGILVLIFALMQAVPYGRNHTNPPAANPFKWTDPQAEAIAKVSCYDCHSNETKWWWATNIAPFSWLVQSDVDGGRSRFNFSNYDGRPSAAGLERAVQDEMPPFQYTLIHPSAKLDAAKKQTLIKGYSDSLAANGGSSSSGSSGQPGQPGSSSTLTTTSADAAAVAIINQVCVGCHSADTALNYHAATAAQAQALIADMVQRGATVSPEQQQVLVQYFTR
jgi:hypothetical protein